MLGLRGRIGALMCLVVLAHVGSASAAGYHSFGYGGKTNFRNVAPQPLPPISLGTGKYPNLLVDGAGTAHIVFTQDGGSSSADTLGFCSLQRGIKTCAAEGVAPNPEPPPPEGDYAGNFPAGNHDFDGPVPLVIGNELFVVQRRFPDRFPTPAGTTSDSNVFEWSSSDGGATLTGPANIGDNQMAGGAIPYGDPNALSIGTISRTETGGTFFQGTQPGVYLNPPVKAQLGVGDQAYDGSLAPDVSGAAGTPPVVRPVAAFADLTGNVFVREFSGKGDPNDAANWSETSFRGFSPQIVGGPAGVFVLSSDSRINGGNLTLRRIVTGQPTGAAVALGRSETEPAISEDSSGRISFAYTDRYGVEVRTSGDGVKFTTPQFTAAVPDGRSIAHLVTAATGDGGGFVSFVKNASGGEGVGQVIVAAFGTQRKTGNPGLGALPGGGIGSAVGDQMATSTCDSAKFGVVDAGIAPTGAGCFSKDPQDPNRDVTLGELNLNGLRVIPDAGTRIGVDPRAHTLDTTGPVRVVLSASGIPDITLYHGELHLQLPNDGPGDHLFDPYLNGLTASKVLGFPIDGSIDVKLASGGVDIPISLTLPKYLGGVTGGAILHVSTSGGLQISSLEFKVADANLGALELKDVDVKYMVDGGVWSGEGELQVPAGGSAFDLKLGVEFSDGKFTKGHFDLGFGYPGIPIDDGDPPPPKLYLSHAGLDLNFQGGTTFTGVVGFGAIPVPPSSGEGSAHDFLVSLDAMLSVAFKSPVTITLRGDYWLNQLQLGTAVLTYTIPDQVQFNGDAHLKLGPLEVKGALAAVIDPRDSIYSASIEGQVDAFSYTLVKQKVVVNNQGLGAHWTVLGAGVNLIYYWHDPFGPKLVFGGDATTRFQTTIPPASSDSHRAHTAAATSFNVPVGAPSASLVVHGAGGAPAVTLVAPGGQQITPGQVGSRASAVAQSDVPSSATYVGIQHPKPGGWSVVEASTSPAPIASLEYAIGERGPKVRAAVTGVGQKRILHYDATFPANVAVTLVEQTGRLLHVIGMAHGGSGAISFRPANGPAGRRQIVAQITNNGLPFSNDALGSYIAPPPPRPGRAAKLRVHVGRQAFTYSFAPPPNATRILIEIAATDGRHLERTASATTRGGSVPVRGRGDGVTITVIGLAPDGSRGPAASASARRKT
jgi:hypothetical protein